MQAIKPATPQMRYAVFTSVEKPSPENRYALLDKSAIFDGCFWIFKALHNAPPEEIKVVKIATVRTDE